MANSGDRVWLMHPVLRVARFDRLGLGRGPMKVINKCVFVTPSAALMKQVDVAEMKRNLFPVFPLVAGDQGSQREYLKVFETVPPQLLVPMGSTSVPVEVSMALVTAEAPVSYTHLTLPTIYSV